jgi:DNA-binding LytR/AlgR family response regulator
MNCILIDPDKKSRQAFEILLQGVEEADLLKSCKSIEQAGKLVLHNETDILFIDAQCLAGAEDIISLFSGPHRFHLVLMAASKQAAVLAFDMEAADFLLKPVSQVRLTKTLAKISKAEKNNRAKSATYDSCLFIRRGLAWEKLSLKEISYIEAAAQNRVVIHTSSKVQHIVNQHMKRVAAHVPEQQFIRVHKSFLVRLDKIDAVEDEYVTVSKRRIPVGANMKELLMAKLRLI